MTWTPADVTPDSSDREPRMSKLVSIEISSERQPRTRVVVRNLSAHGIGARGDCNILPCERVTVHLPDGRMVAATVRWVRKGTFGLSLDERIEPGAVQSKAGGRLADIVPKDAEAGFERYRHYASQSRTGFSRSHREEVLKVSSDWKGGKRDSDWV